VGCRIEEVSLAIGASGEEAVTLGVRGEATEIEITPTPQLVAPDSGTISPFVSDPAGAVTYPLVAPTGKSYSFARVKDMDVIGALLQSFRERISRAERH